MKPIIYFLTAGLLLVASQVFGQALVTTFNPATVTAPIGSTVSLQLKVTNFNNINSVQFPITYNASVLEFDTINNVALPGFNAGNFNVPTAGKITISWFADPGAYPDGFTVAGGTSIMTVHFKVLTNGSTAVNLANSAPGIEVIRNGAPITVNFASGGAQVTGGSGGPGPIQGFAIIANTIYIPQGTTACMPVTVNDFTSITAMQYAMHWDKNVLQYQNTQGYNLPDLTASSFGAANAANGLLLMGWSDPQALGVTRSNGTKIYDVCFNAVGPVGSQSLITIDSIGFPAGNGGAEAFNASSQNVWKSTSGVTDTIFVVTAPPPPNAVTFTATFDTVNTGQQACIDVTVKNFTKIISMQYGLTYDATKLTFVSVTPNLNVPGLTAASFNPNTPGQIKLSWSDPAAVGASLPDNTLLFTVCFTAAAPPVTNVPVNFGSLPGLPVEVVKEPDGPVNPAFVNGNVRIDTAAATPPVSASISPKPACGANNGSATATGTGGTPTSYAWSGPNGAIPGNQATINNLAGGTYNVTVTFSGGKTATATATVAASPTINVAQVQIQNVKCFGETNGAINLAASGGSAPLTFDWDGPNGFDKTTEDISGLTSGAYTLKITDNLGCTSSPAPFQVGGPSAALSTSLITSQNVACFGDSTGKATINVAGGTVPYFYSWLLNGNLYTNIKNPTNLPAGSYTLQITDVNGCSTTLSNPVNITGPSSALTIANPVTKTDVACWGASTGSINLNINGGWPGQYNVTWNPANSGASLTNIPAGNYTATVTDLGGCSKVVGPVQIIQPPAFEDTLLSLVHNICHGDGDGSIIIDVSGGNGAPYTIDWNGSTLSGASIANLDGGLYTPTVKDANGCTTVLPGYTVNEPPAIDTSNVVLTPPTPGNKDGSIELDLGGGTGGLTINWTGPNFSATTEDIFNLGAGAYTILVTDDNDCVFSATYNLGGALSATAIVTSGSCGNDGCINVNIVGGVPPYQISWTGTSGGTFFTDDPSATICTFAPGAYNLNIADNNSNAITLPTPLIVNPKEPALVSSSKIDPTQDLANGSITVNPLPAGTPMTYSWSGPNNFTSTASTIMNRDSGLYTVTVTNQNSQCTAVYTFQLNRQWDALVVNAPEVNAPNCTYSTDGSISIVITGGNTPYTFKWTGPNGPISDTDNIINNIGPGTYNVTVTDENGTTIVPNSITVNAESQLAITNVNETSNYGGFQVSGATECDGAANIAFTGGVGATSILWSNNVTGAQNNTLCAGNYTVTVTDNLGCTAVWSDSLTSPSAIVANATVFNPIACNGECDGVLRVFVNGGVAPYTVKWSNGQVDQLAAAGNFSQSVNLCGGDYTVTVTDKFFVDYVTTVTLVEPAEIAVVFNAVDPTSFNSCDGELIADVPGGTAPITYTWSGSLGHAGNGQRAERLCAGEIVQFVITDANGCTGIGVDTVDYPEDGCFRLRPVITPGQQDGNNDFLLISCVESSPENTLEIYNRWGQLVFETKGYDNVSNVWHGTSKNGQPLAEGVYFYVFTYIDPVKGETQEKGHINLLR